ncbi:hypothetical protein LCGC14_1208250 [marine sediment metagenome]|uniref:AAA+ ATPase domain-containing protein n=1 Tax=marine sediment metagenome TaxID=412755 RepID=A0A0F9LJ90_9ZZZZ
MTTKNPQTDKTHDKIIGDIKRIIYQAADGGFFIASIYSKENGKSTVTGISPTNKMPRIGIELTFHGQWTTHPKFGKQFKFAYYEENIPTDTDGMRKFLENYVHGLGPVKAKAIIEEFGEDTFKIIEDNPEELKRAGLTPNEIQKVTESFSKFKHDKNHLSKLSQWGLTPAAINNIIGKYGELAIAIQKIEDNPYILAEDVSGFGFLRADVVARSLGIELDDPRRLREAIVYALKDAAQDGHTYMEEKKLIYGWDKRDKGVMYLVGSTISMEQIEEQIEELCRPINIELMSMNRISEWYEDNGNRRLSLINLYKAEKTISKSAIYLHEKTFEPMKLDEENEDFLKLTEKQRDSLLQITKGESGFAIITGGAGVGKTFLITQIIAAIEGNGQSFSLMAPTGKAAKRITETTGYAAKTIHRFLAFNSIVNDFTLPETFDNFIIVDEASMIDSALLARLMIIMTKEKNRLILIGDANQLSPVAAGNPLLDLINSKMFNVTFLNKIMRTEGDSLIPINANHILQGNRSKLSFDDEQMGFKNINDATMIPDFICSFIESGIFNLDEIQVISPQHKGPVGTIILNEVLQEVFNPLDDSKKLSSFDYLIGDKVIFTKNNYEIGYVNGDQGKVKGEATGPKNKKMLIITNDQGEDLEIFRDDIWDIELAYAITIHKSQGSEWPCIIMPIHETTSFMLSRNLVYTAITRGRYSVILVGSEKGLAVACRNVSIGKRFTLIPEFLEELIEDGREERYEGEHQEFYEGEGEGEEEEEEIPF